MTATTTPSSVTEVLDYVHSRADEQDLEALIQAVKTRRNVLGEQRAAAVRTGTEVRLDGLSPKYLNKLTGIIETTKGSRADVRLDKGSTATLRYAGKKFYIPITEETFLLTGVPKQCCRPN